MRSQQIRDTFLDFFDRLGHVRVPSSPLIPDDPSLLLVNAGMVPFKPYFTGERTPPWQRASSLQRCVRTVDIERIGHTTRHATCFEMLGSFSFGDYFKDEIVPWAYALMTEGFGLDPDRLWATVFTTDDDAYALWRSVGLPDSRIQRLGTEDNFWSTGLPGPGGPCSEIFYDRGERFGRDGGPAANNERFLELWNLVFMNLRRGESDEDILGELPHRNIDTGLGVDRLAMVVQGVEHITDTDLLRPTLLRLEELSRKAYAEATGSERVSFRIVTDHLRAAAFLIGDGILPGNEGRGYVLRRLVRRALRHGGLLGLTEPFAADLVATVVENLGGVWSELSTGATTISEVVAREEEAFARTLRQGGRLLATELARTGSGGQLSGSTAFTLHDTYGFPVELTMEIAADAGLSLDRDEFERLMGEQRDRARTHRGEGGQGGPVGLPATDFLGYSTLAEEATVLGLLVDGSPVPVVTGGPVDVVLDRTPFYAEAGGQIGDSGILVLPDGGRVRVDSTRSSGGVFVHSGRLDGGTIAVGDPVTARVDADRRHATERAHSATHVLHATLREHLGDHARQHGSLVEPGRLRFDFVHFDAVDPGRLGEIEDHVNRRVLDNPAVRVWEATRDEARSAGATALFGEKYGETVRIVDIGDFSRELCGGTHVGMGALAGPVRLLGESSIGSGVRRVSALVGVDALRHASREREVLREVSTVLKSDLDGVVPRLADRLGALADAERRLSAYRRKELDELVARLTGQRVARGPGWLVTGTVADLTPAELRAVATRVASDLGTPGTVVLGQVVDGKAQLIAAVNDDRVAVELLRGPARIVGGGAGGTGPVATAGGRDGTRLREALAAV
ncbi:alanine--tRNA ligase [Hamadaea tsunoensis]|uniref:alanine--tRNA ligase n=1 Tax=Hamadaea tsunoensis TaxID=53368 RepID=UPI0004238E7A|nr:alanine--tRNA ligase [Hamadaea tsunoensis]